MPRALLGMMLTGTDFFTDGDSIEDVAMYGGALGASVRRWRDLTLVGAHL